jgi:hypothetical protein
MQLPAYLSEYLVRTNILTTARWSTISVKISYIWYSNRNKNDLIHDDDDDDDDELFAAPFIYALYLE